MSISQSSSVRLQQILLSWDYWDLDKRTQEGEGAMQDLKAVPSTFSSVQVTLVLFNNALQTYHNIK